MKKQVYSMMLMLSALLLTGCSEDIYEGGVAADGEEVTFTIGVTIPAPLSTRAFGDEAPNITVKSLRLVVFSEDHYIRQNVKAVPVKPGTNGEFLPVDSDEDGYDEQLTYFKVTLNSSENPLIIHLIANYDKADLPFGSEGELIGNLQATPDSADVYWQRVEGVTIKAVTEQEKLSGIIPAPAKLKKVPLVRNYAKINVMNTEADFKMTGYALYNLPDRGSVAPRISQNNFAAYWDGTARTCLPYNTISQTYSGNEPSDAGTLDPVWVSPNDNAGTTFNSSYVYEHRNVGNPKSVFLLVKGIYKNDPAGETYFKVDLVYLDNDNITHYYNILRNFVYTVNIEHVTSSGFSTAELALANPASNNISGSTMVSDFSNISDGIHQIFVDKTEIYIVNTDPVTFQYMYKENIHADGGDINNDAATVVAPAGNVLAAAAQVATTDGTTEGVDLGWRKVTLTPKEPQAQEKRQTIYVTTTSGLMREVELILRLPYVMQVDCTPDDVYQTYNNPITVSVFLPTGLPESIFPLDFMISSDKNSIYPQANTDMPVKVNASGGYGFVKKLRYIDYQKLTEVQRDVNGASTPMKQMDCYFMTNQQNSASTVTVTNPYFNPASDSFTSNLTGVISKVSIDGTERYGKNHDVVAKFTLTNSGNTQQTYTVTVTCTEGEYTTRKTVNVTVARNSTSDEQLVTFKTKAFADDIKITIAQGDQSITIPNPKKRHIVYIPAGSFRFDASVAGNYSLEKSNDGNTTYLDYANDTGGDFEWPNFYVDGVESGSRKMYPTSGILYAIEVDATFGGRDMTFTRNSEMTFETYYNLDSSGNLIEGRPLIATHTLGEITDAYNGNDAPITMTLNFESSNSGGAKPAWSSDYAPARKNQ